MIPYTIRYTRKAVEEIYKIPRGIAGEVTEAIKTLSKTPRPPHSFEAELENGLAMKIAGYFITYKIYEEEHLIMVVVVEAEDQASIT